MLPPGDSLQLTSEWGDGRWYFKQVTAKKKNMYCHIHTRKNRLQVKKWKRNKDRWCVVIEGATHQEDVAVINIYVPTLGAPK